MFPSFVPKQVPTVQIKVPLGRKAGLGHLPYYIARRK
jgi:hypothetical protein